MVSLAEQVGSSIAKRRLFCRQQRILVAVSGGVDSMVLLHVLHELSRESGWQLTVAHLNHRLRGASSLADERLVRRTAEGLKLPIVVSRADVRGFVKASGLSLEMAARKLRHDFLARVALERGIPSIALAHHQDDQVELFFLRLLRGSGSQGLAGMKWRNPSPGNPAISLVRPLLDRAKSALRDYAAQRKIHFREDATNNSLDIQRNRIRHELLPLLERGYQTAVGKTILRVMDIVGAEADLVNAIAESWLARRIATRAIKTSRLAAQNLAAPNIALLRPGFEATPFEALPVAVQRRCLQLDLIRNGIVPDYDVVEHLRLQPERPVELRRQSTVAPVLREHGAQKTGDPPQVLSSLRLVRKPQGIVRVSPVVTVPFRPEGCNLDLQGSQGKLDWDGVSFAWRILPMNRALRPKSTPGTELFDADAVGARVILRHWRPGDRFQPIGMSRAVKLQDLFVNQKVPRERRRCLAVAATACGDLFWVEGLRISERFKLTKSTIRRLHWAWQRL